MLFGIILGLTDGVFDWIYHYDGEDPFLVFLVKDLPGHEAVWRGAFIVLSLLFGTLISYIYNKRKSAQLDIDNIFENSVPICITNNDFDIIRANSSYYRIFGPPAKERNSLKCYEHRPGPKCQTEECPLQAITKGKELYTCESKKIDPNKIDRTYLVYATPYRDRLGRTIGIIECFQDITARKDLEVEKEQLIGRLNSALKEVKKLSGFLPICSSCKKVRDDKGYWKQIETYVEEHSDAEFGHSICPECAANYYEKLEK